MDIVCKNSGVHFNDIKNPRYKLWMICTNGGERDEKHGKTSFYTGWMTMRIGEFERLKGTRGFNQDEFTQWLEKYVENNKQPLSLSI